MHASGMKASAARAAQILSEAGHLAYFAGGCVRDMLLGLESKDIDIATSARPEEVKALFPGSRMVGAHFGVVLVPVNEFFFDVATFREDGEYLDGRRPEGVVFSSPEKDAMRRDFTVNGLFENPETGEIIDFVGGKKDLEDRLLRAIGIPGERFREDALRLLRAVRFAVTKGFEIEQETYRAIRECSGMLARISPERIRDEFDRILVSPQRRRGVEMLVETGLMKHIIPEVEDLIGCMQPPEWHPEGDVFVHTMMMLDRLSDQGEEPDIHLALSVLLHDIAKPAAMFRDETGRIRFSGHDKLGSEMCRTILKRLRYSNEIVDAVAFMVGRHMQFINVQHMREAKVRQFMVSDFFDDEMKLHRADCLSSNGALENYQYLLDKKREYDHEAALPAPFLTGRHLIEMGWKPGAEFKKVLDEVFLEQLEGRVTSLEEALTLAVSLNERNREK